MIFKFVVYPISTLVSFFSDFIGNRVGVSKKISAFKYLVVYQIVFIMAFYCLIFEGSEN
jgi:hypothetical protein